MGKERVKDKRKKKDKEGVYTEHAENAEVTEKNSRECPRLVRRLFVLGVAKKEGRAKARPYRS